MNSINLRLVQNEENSEDWQTRMLEEVDTVWMTEQEIREIAITEKIHWAWDFRYGTVCLMAMCCCRWELLVWSRDEDHWHWRDQGTGKRVLNALPTWHKNSLRWWQKLERRKVYMSQGEDLRGRSLQQQGIEVYARSVWVSKQGEYFRNGIKEAVGSKKYHAGGEVQTHLEGHKTSGVSRWEVGHS